MTAFYMFRAIFLTFGGNYRGGAPAVTALVGGHVDMVFQNLSESIEQIRAAAEDLGERTLRGMTRPVAVRNLTSLKG